MARYRKIEVAVWNDDRFCELTPAKPNGQTLWLYLLTGPRTTTFPGLVIARDAVIASDLRWTLEGFREAFREVSSKGMAKACWKAGVVVLPRALLDSLGEPRDTSRPESPNVIKSWAKSWDEVPACDLKNEYLRALESFTKGLGEAFHKAFLEGFRKALAKASTHPSPNQDSGDRNRRQEQEQDSSAPPVAEKKASKSVRLGDGWIPERSEANERAEATAKSRGVDLRTELEKLRDWAKGNNAKKADWDAVWRNWLRNAKAGAQNHNTQSGLDFALRVANGDA